MQAWDWGGVALYSMLSVLNALWFGWICNMVAKGLKRKQKADTASTPVGDTVCVQPLDAVKQPVKMSSRPAKAPQPVLLYTRGRRAPRQEPIGNRVL